jgi:hypothetical protein
MILMLFAGSLLHLKLERAGMKHACASAATHTNFVGGQGPSSEDYKYIPWSFSNGTSPSRVGQQAIPEIPYDLLPSYKSGLPILLWDLNGTLTSHVPKRGSAGQNLVRPGIKSLRRLSASLPYL